jgi:hemolysin-activating ACP:hemolysin acyltransferase
MLTGQPVFFSNWAFTSKNFEINYVSYRINNPEEKMFILVLSGLNLLRTLIAPFKAAS